MRVVVAEGLAAMDEIVLVQPAGFGVAAHVPEPHSEVRRGRQRVLVVAEPLAPALAQAVGKVMAGA